MDLDFYVYVVLTTTPQNSPRIRPAISAFVTMYHDLDDFSRLFTTHYVGNIYPLHLRRTHAFNVAVLLSPRNRLLYIERYRIAMGSE